MPTVKELLQNVKPTTIVGPTNVVVGKPVADSRKVEQGDCFFAITGTVADGHKFIDDCIAKGATAIVCERLPATLHPEVCYVQVQSASFTMGVMAHQFYGSPSLQLKLVGITGTNGKTSTATLLFRLFRKLGYNVGLLSTVQNQINDELIAATHTTPDAISLNALLQQMVDKGCEYCFMEVSSHAADQNRIAGLLFTGAGFTNITHDHLDYHKTFDNYIKAKKKFFDQLPASAFAVTNADDKNGLIMLQNTAAKRYTYSLRTPSDFKAKIIDNDIAGLHLEIDNKEMYTRLIGEFNAYNITLVYSIARLLGIDATTALTELSVLGPPEGRFDQTISSQHMVGITDYAHTPDALKNVLQTINDLRQGNSQIITVVGCGGDRDAAKRPLMAQIAAKFSDKVILTSDNPRSEDPNVILQQMNEGIAISDKRKVLTIADRREAIRTAVTIAQSKDIILLAGKGHEKYQEIKGVKYPFDDKVELLNAFVELDK